MLAAAGSGTEDVPRCLHDIAEFPDIPTYVATYS